MLLSERVGAIGEPRQVRLKMQARGSFQTRDRALIIKNLGSAVAYIDKIFGNRGLFKINTPGGYRGGKACLRYV